MNARLPSAPSEASTEASKAAPTEGGVSVKTKQEAQELTSRQQRGELQQEVSQAQAESGVDVDADEEATSPTGSVDSGEEPGFAESLGAYYATARARGGNWLSAGLSTLAFAVSSGGSKFWDFAKGLFSGKKKEEDVTDVDEDEDTDSDFALDTDTSTEAASAQPHGFVENMKALLSQFGLTETADKKKNFFLVATALGKEVQAQYGIPYQVVVAQACLESGFGQSGLTQKALNCFGYKTGSSNVPYVTMETTEYRNGVRGREPARFRSYSSLRDSFMDYGRLLSGADRYKKAFDYKDDPKRFLEEVIKAGYATDPNYVAKAEKTVATYGLNLA